MVEYTLPIVFIVGGLIAVVWGANEFVKGAAATALNFGLSPLIVGLTVVGLGTSAPEMIVAIMASTQGKAQIALGNALGSNITNIALILGLVALIKPINVESRIVSRELPLLIIISLSAMALLLDGRLARLDGILLTAGLFIVMTWLVQQVESEDSDGLEEKIISELPDETSKGKAIFLLLFGMAVLLGGSHILVDGAVDIAQMLGVSDLVIGLTIIAIGTSLPELAAALAATYKGLHDLTIGNVIGSNVFNLLTVMSIPGLIAPGPVPGDVISRDVPILITLTLAFFAFAFKVGNRQGRINRAEGFALFSAFIGYQLFLYFSTAA